MTMFRLKRVQPLLCSLLIGGWGCGVFAMTASMVRYQMTPAPATATTPDRWPVVTRIALDPARPTLVMSLHPQCPCSTASLRDLESLMAHASRPMTVDILFVKPQNAPPGWTDSALWREAAAMPDVNVSIDTDGEESRIFGATASGDVAFYGVDGKLMFHGGITDSRGHEGDSAGQTTIRALLRDEQPAVCQTPVYGCLLRAPTPVPSMANPIGPR